VGWFLYWDSPVVYIGVQDFFLGGANIPMKPSGHHCSLIPDLSIYIHVLFGGNHELDRCSRYFCYDHNQPASPVHERSLPSWQIISYSINKDSHGLWEFPGRWGRRMGYGPCETFLQGRGENDPALPGRDRRFCWRNGTFDPISVTTPLLFFPLIMKFEINTRQTLCLEGHVLRRLQDLFDI